MADEKSYPGGNDAPISEADGEGSKHEVEEHGAETSLEYPEGGLRAWLVVSGAAAVMFCTFGYLTGFG